jgi:flagellin-like protein
MNKKGVSEIVSYVLLIIIAVTLSVMVYSFLELYVPKEKAECTKDISLIIINYTCTINTNPGEFNGLNITFSNRGLFSVDAVYVRVGDDDAKDLINDKDLFINYAFGQTELPPGKKVFKNYTINSEIINSPREIGLEIQPAIITEKGVALCEEAIISQKINCVS